MGSVLGVRARLVTLGLVASLGSSCAHHVVTPRAAELHALVNVVQPSQDGASELVEPPPSTLLLRHCIVDGETVVDDRYDVRRFCDGLAATWEDEAGLRVVHPTAATADELKHAPRVDVVFKVDRTHMVTGFAEIVAVYTFGIFPIVPAWDWFTIELTLEAHGADGQARGTLEARAEGRTWVLLYSAYLTAYIEDALRETYDELFRQSTQWLRVNDEAVFARCKDTIAPEAAPTLLEPGAANESLSASENPSVHPELQAEPPRRRADCITTDNTLPRHPLLADADRVGVAAIWLTGEEVRDAVDPVIVVRERKPVAAGWWGAVAGSLGGLEASTIIGLAKVSSRATNEFGVTSEIASGRATQSGYKIANYAAPRTTGFFLLPSLGYLDQKIAIEDFRADLPVIDAPGQEIGAVCSDPTTGAPLDCTAPNVYELRLRSGFAGARVGTNLVIGDSTTEFFATANAAANLVELREVTAKVATYQAKGTDWALGRSFSAGTAFGLRWPKAHLALHLTGEVQLYRDFTYAEPLEFKGFVAFNPDKNVYERPRTWVEGADLLTYSFSFALAGVF